MRVNIEALVELRGVKADTEKVAKSLNEETGLAARIANYGRVANEGRGNVTNVPGTYRIFLSGTSESEEEANSLLNSLRSMMGNYGKNGNHPAVAAWSVEPIIPETQATVPVPPAYGVRNRPRQNHRYRGRR